MEAPDIASTEIGTVHMEDVEVHNGEASPATGDSAVEYIFTAGAPSFAHLKSRYGGRRIPHRSALLASALALAASITVFLVWSALCELPSSKTATVGLVKRRLSYGQAYGQYGYTLSNTEQSCAVLETNLKAIQNALWPDKEPAQKKLRLTADEYGPGARTTEETPWLQPLRGASCWSSSACSEASSSLLTSGLKQLSSPESELESLPWTGLPTNEVKQAAPTIPFLRSSAGGSKEAKGAPHIPSLIPLWTAQDIQLQGNPFARMPEFDAMPTRSWPACEQRETQNTTLLSEAVSINSQNLFGAHLPTVEDCAPVAPSPVAAYLRPVKEELINPLARVDFQTSADVDGTADCRSKRIAEIAKMLSLAADEFEKSSKLVHERLQAASCGQVSAQEQPQRQGSTKRAVVESPVGASVRNPEVVARSSAELIMRAHPSFDLKRPLDGKDAGTMMNLSVSLPSSETEQQQALLQHDYTALKYGNPAASPRPSVPREHSGAARQEASGGRLLSNLQLDSTNAADSKDNEDPKTSVRAVKVERNLDIPHLGTTENMEHQAAAVQETPRREGPSSLVTTFSEAGNKCAETSSPVNGGEHPYVRLPVVPREAIKRNFDYKAALFCRLHERSALEVLGTMRTLFAKEVLNWIEVNKLLSACQRLVNYAFFLLQSPYPVQLPCRAIRKLGLIFLTFDAVVCTIELLGENMLIGAWWGKFTSAFNTNYHLNAKGKDVRAETGRAGLCNRLLAALQIYKAGKRPPADEIISLKRSLFCSEFSADIFWGPQWSPWRLDDKDWCAAKKVSS